MRFGELAIAAADVKLGSRGAVRGDVGERCEGEKDGRRGEEGREELPLEGDFGGGETPSPAAASVSRNSTHRRENDYIDTTRCRQYQTDRKTLSRTSVSSFFSNSGPFGLVARPHIEDPMLGRSPPFFCNPAFSLSSSFQDRMDESRDNISKRLGSARGVQRNDSRTFVTSRLSTLVSVDERRKRRRASMR